MGSLLKEHFRKVVGDTGLEPVTPLLVRGGALPTEPNRLLGQTFTTLKFTLEEKVVGDTGLEPVTPSL